MGVTGKGTWNYQRWDPDAGAWVNDGDYPAPVQEVPIEDGRTAGLQVSRDVNGKKILLRSAERSEQGSIRMRWFVEKSGADAYEIYHKINEWVKTGAGIRIITHIAGLEYQGYFRGSPRLIARSRVASEQLYEPRANFELFPVDGTGAGW